jgi:hypothetical protein
MKTETKPAGIKWAFQVSDICSGKPGDYEKRMKALRQSLKPAKKDEQKPG